MKKICVITSTRAEYGLLSSVIEEIERSSDLQLLLIATGAHLDVNYGETYKEIEADGFRIDYKIPINEVDTEIGILRTMSNGLQRIGTVLEQEKPDILVLLGDRYELLSFASAALVLRIPVAHISGGEITEGAIDEYVRHAITKLSSLHFASTDEYRKRIIQMGEQPRSVYNVGDLGVYNVKQLTKFSKNKVEEQIKMPIRDKLVQVTFHPETLSNNSVDDFKELLDALSEASDLQVVFTKANADLGGTVINQLIDEFVKINYNRARAFYSLGYKMFLSLLSYSLGIVGNSSSGIVEAPSLHIGTVNIGNRQKGRIRATSVIDCDASKEDILKNIYRMQSSEFQTMLDDVINPYEAKDTPREIVVQIKNFVCKSGQVGKVFFDIDKVQHIL